ncbi:unnamed protein product [Urochloa decumbens]|uniref:poly(A)-specific ribonuclease n=1 Tax=Urochloa decumbens TaxID=240449 RepID=A0ABC8W5K9_9POAL
MSPPPRAEPSAGGCGKKVRVVDVWAHNQEAEQARILTLVHAYPIVAVATSHDVPVRWPPPPAAAAGTLDGNYEAVRAGVERVRFAQLGVSLASADGDMVLARAWRFHLGDALGAEDRRFLAAVGVDPGPTARRADPRRLSVALRVACAIEALPDGGVLVTRDGAEDVAYVVRHLRGPLPPCREEFLRSCNAAFPALYDLKVMAEWTTTAATEPPLAAAGRDAFRGLLALVRARRHGGGVLTGYNAFLPGLGAADTIELMSIKTTMAEDAERLRQMKELFRELYPGQDPAIVDRLPLC